MLTLRLTSAGYPDGTIAYTYNILDPAKVVNRLGYTNFYGYNNIRQMVAETSALGFHTFFGYCLCGGSIRFRTPLEISPLSIMTMRDGW
jgi:hypothetical protein